MVAEEEHEPEEGLTKCQEWEEYDFVFFRMQEWQEKWATWRLDCQRSKPALSSPLTANDWPLVGVRVEGRLETSLLTVWWEPENARHPTLHLRWGPFACSLVEAGEERHGLA